MNPENTKRWGFWVGRMMAPFFFEEVVEIIIIENRNRYHNTITGFLWSRLDAAITPVTSKDKQHRYRSLPLYYGMVHWTGFYVIGS